VEEHIGLVVLEHLGDKLDIHIVNIDFLLNVLVEVLVGHQERATHLQALVQHHDGLVQFLLYPVNNGESCDRIHQRTTLVMILESRTFCWCSCGLSYVMSV
jgi:hypothetical protein